MAFDGVGIRCPTCGGDSQVVDSRGHKGKIRRRRVCDEGHRFSTLEATVSVRAVRARPPKQKKMLANLDLPLTYLTIAQKERARAFFKAGWKVQEVAPLFNMTQDELRK